MALPSAAITNKHMNAADNPTHAITWVITDA